MGKYRRGKDKNSLVREKTSSIRAGFQSLPLRSPEGGGESIKVSD